MDLRKLEEKLAKSGFPLELGCTHLLQRRNWGVMNNFLFEDPEEHKHREIDAFACDAPAIFDDKSCLTVYVLVECKKSAYPWVFFPSIKKTDRTTLGLRDMIFRDGETKRTHDESDSLVSDLRWNSRFISSEISSWFFETEEKKHVMHDAISKLAKAAYYVTVGQREDSEPLHPPCLFVVYQAIVLDGLLCSAALRGRDIHLSPKKQVVLGMNFICPSFRTHMLVDVIHASYFSKYVKIIEAERDKFVEMANDFYHRHPKFGALEKST
jgi:hypothetical protein